MSIKVSQINQLELEKFVDERLKTVTLTGIFDAHLDEVSVGDMLVFAGSPSVWYNQPIPEQPHLTADGLCIVAGSPPTKELLAVDHTVTRRNTRNFFTMPVGGKRNAPIVFSSGAPGFIFDEVGAEKDESSWRFFASDGNLQFDIRNDGNSTSKNWLFVQRTGFDINLVGIEADEVTINGEKVVTESQIQDLIDRIEALENA